MSLQFSHHDLVFFSRRFFRGKKSLVVVCLLATVSLIFSMSKVFAQNYTSEHPDVVAAIEKGIKYLEANGDKETRTGGVALAALALIKNGVPQDHTLVQHAVGKIRKCIITNRDFEFDHPIYSASISAVLLCELDLEEHQRELDALAFYVQRTQRWDGSWSYMSGNDVNSHPSGDMSMTQNAIMAAWSLHNHGFPISEETINRAADFLILAQNDKGMFPYQTAVAKDMRSANHQGPSISMTAAGMSGVYICRNMFRYDKVDEMLIKTARIARERREKIESMQKKNAKPAVFRKIEGKRAAIRTYQPGAAIHGRVSKANFDLITEQGNHWMETNYQGIQQSTTYWHYYLYALERYETFRELSENRSEESPEWYNWVAKHLISTQSAEGSWQSGCGVVPDTAFSILVLCRSTKKAIEQQQIPEEPVAGGNMRGGRGLPNTTDDVFLKDGQIVSLSEMQSAQGLLEKIEELENIDEESLVQLAKLPEKSIKAFLTPERTQIAKTWLDDKNGTIRVAAAEMCGKSGDVNCVPQLITALSDPEYRVVEAAHEALKRISRSPKLPALPPSDSQNFSQQIENMRKYWIRWYQTIDPNYAPE